MATGQDALWPGWGEVGTLPTPLTRLVGREREVARVVELLGATRLLTLTGSGGVGKTRIAIAAAHAAADTSWDAARWVDLAPLADPALVPQAVAIAVGVREDPGRPILAALLAGLHGRRLLLVVDNAEHLIDAVARLVEALLHGCPDLVVLVTSREPLAADGETTWRVPSLAVPAPDDRPSPDDLGRFEAATLFLERARATLPDLGLTADGAAAVAEVCRRLDGIPLALELAAARVPVLGLAGLAARLDDRLRLLTGGRRTALRRQQTLRATLDWSHDLLAEPERVLFRRLAVFAGGWTLDAAEAVGASGVIEAGEVLDLLTRLVDKSLVLAEQAGGTVRYRLLETVRQYAGERLHAAGESGQAARRHTGYFLAVAEHAAPRLDGSAIRPWLDRLEAEHDNLRAALAWRLADADGAADGLQLAAALGLFWLIRDHQREGLGWLERALSRPTPMSTARLEALFWAGELAHRLADLDRAATLAAEGLVAAQGLGDRKSSARLTCLLGLVAFHRGDLALARAHLAEALRLGRTASDPVVLGYILFQRGRLHIFEGEEVAAILALEEALAHVRRHGDAVLTGYVLEWLALAVARQGDHGRARALLRESLTLGDQVGERQSVAAALRGLGLVARLAGEVGEAQARYAAALRLQWETGARLAVPGLLGALAWAAAAQGRRTRAARLLGAATAYLVANGQALPAAEGIQFERDIATVRAGLGEAAFAAAWAAGQALPLAAAVAEALTVEAGLVAAPGQDGPVSGALTGRERAVAGQIARGLTNRQIAAELSISPHTVERHVENILNKLGVTSRTQIAAWAVAQGLEPPPGV